MTTASSSLERQLSPGSLERLAALSPSRRRLVEVMQTVGFGQIVGLVLRGGEPILDPPPRILRSVKLGGEARPDPEPSAENYVLKKPLCDLFDEFDRLGTGVVARLDLKDGLPCSLIIEDQPLRMNAARPGRAE